MKMKKIEKMSLIFEFSISKLGYTEIFIKVFGKNILTHFLGYYWLVKAKMKMNMKNYGKTSSILEFSISKLGYVAIFLKICEKKFWFIF